MNTTSVSLLERLRQPGQQDAWTRFVRLYTPLIFHWARRVGLPSDDAADLVQDVLTALVQKLPEFAYDRSKSFRGWLRTVTLNKWRDSRRRRAAPHPAIAGAVPDVEGPDTTAVFEEAEYRQHLVKRALELILNQAIADRLA